LADLAGEHTRSLCHKVAHVEMQVRSSGSSSTTTITTTTTTLLPLLPHH
jgi:hypothetical protein